MNLVMLVLAALTTARLTRLVTTDRITLGPRRWLLRRLIARYGEDSLPPYLLVCDWCVSIWAGGAVAAAWLTLGDTLWFQAPAAALTLSYVTGWLASQTEE